MKKCVLFLLLGFACTAFITAQNFESDVKKGVDFLSTRINQKLDVRIGKMTLNNIDAPSEFSLYLAEKIDHYATNNNMFNVINSRNGRKATDPPVGAIEAVYTMVGENMDVTMRLVLNSANRGSHSFTIPAAELKRLNKSHMPENYQAVIDREEAFAELKIPQMDNFGPPIQPKTQVQNSLNIQAWCNSDTNTFFDGDKLIITLLADRDCYFKVYYIDVEDNPPQMIFPIKDGPDNKLRANIPREIPGLPFPNDGWPLHDPYGTETIWVQASTEQFKNIEAEYIPPGRISVKDGIRGVSQLRLSGTFTAETRFNYSILSTSYSSETYSFNKPSNMRQAIDEIRNNVNRQGGTFTGTEQQGTFTVNGTTGSYRVTGNTVTMSFRYTGGQLPGTTRGAGSSLNFTIDKPRNMEQAVQAVRSGIEGKGGVFTGNAQQGDFRVSSMGLAGRYSVSDKVSVTISEKPVLIPNSLIEKEVRNYFTGK